MIYPPPRTPQRRATAMRSVTAALVEAYALRPAQTHLRELPDGRCGRGGVLACDRAGGSAP